jgi:pilus assembly protein CpaC
VKCFFDVFEIVVLPKWLWSGLWCLGLILALANRQAQAQSISETPVKRNQALERSVSGQQAAKSITLFVGQVKVIDRASSNVIRVAVGNGSLLKANVIDNRQIVLLGEGAGETTVYLWMRDGSESSFKVVIHPQDLERVRRDIQSLFEDLPEITIRVVGQKLWLEGAYRDGSAASRVQRVLAMYPGVLNLIQDDLPNVRPVRLDPMIHLDLRVVEVRKRALDQLGINWASSADGPTFATSVAAHTQGHWEGLTKQGFPVVNSGQRSASFLGLASQITSVLQFLEQNGDSWTLAEPRLSCKSGGKSKFVAGGEIPIPVATGIGQTSVVYKQYGVVIEFNPVSDAQGNIESGIEVEVSEPDPRNSNQGFVAFTTHRTTTQVALKHNTPLVISGLLRQQRVKSIDGVPGLSKLPVLGGIFRAQQDRNEETELLVVVTPRLVTADSALNTTSLQRSQLLLDENRPQLQKRLEK